MDGNVKLSLKKQMLSRIQSADPFFVWTPVDFLDIGARDAVDKNLQRLSNDGTMRRIARGLYDTPKSTPLLDGLPPPHQGHVLEAVARRSECGLMCDGMTAANKFGLTNAVPAHIVRHTSKRIKSVNVDGLDFTLRFDASKKMRWANRPSADFIQALYWLKPIITSKNSDDKEISVRVRQLFEKKSMKPVFEDFHALLLQLPVWLQTWFKNQKLGSQ